MINLVKQMQRSLSAEKSVLYLLSILSGNGKFKKMLKDKRADETISDVFNKYMKENSEK